MSKSILQDEKKCYFCGSIMNLERHHIFFGTANRRKSEEFGCWVYLCKSHHTGILGVHFDKDADLKLKKQCQKQFEKLYCHEKFMHEFGRNWI